MSPRSSTFTATWRQPRIARRSHSEPSTRCARGAGRRIAPEDILLAELISSALAGAAYGGRLAETLTRRNEQLTMVADIAAHVSSSLETREVYRLVVQKLNEYFKVEAGSLLLHDE